VSGIRGKISAGDLLSAESILEVHRIRHGEDDRYLHGLAWLARGAWLLGEPGKARRYVEDVRTRCAAKLAAGTKLEDSYEVEYALGSAIEVQAQWIQRDRGKRAAAEFLRGELAALPGTVALRSRLQKRLNLLTLVGSPAPEIEVEDFLGPGGVTLAGLRGKPAVLFLWDPSCGDCRAQSLALGKVQSRYAARGLQTVALTRYHEKDVTARLEEKARADSVWKADYRDVGEVPVVFSTAAMERYGGSSTPTFVFVDRAGVVRGYLPYRLTEEELDRAVEPILR
jgi:thiol-disulfide isomerase/thioredoxin